MKRTFLSLLAALSIPAAAMLAGLAATPVEAAMKLKAGSVLPKDSDQGQAIEFFAKRVKEMTNGEIEVQAFHSGELGPPPAQYKNAIDGAQDPVIDTLDYFNQFDKRFGVINTPFVFRGREHFGKFLNSPAFAEIAKTVEARGLVFLGNYNWMRQQDRGILSRKPIIMPADLQGVKMRMFQAEMPIQAWSAMGANIQVYSWADTYTAMATGAVDSLTTVVSASYLVKHIEVLKYFTNLQEYYQIVLPVISKITWNKLNKQQQDILVKAANEAGEVYVKASKANDERDTLRAQDELGLTIIVPPMKPWQEKAAAMHKALEDKDLLPKGIIEAAKAIK